jgi:hypothetical protein
MPSVRAWQVELPAIADQLERSASQWSLDHAEVDDAAERLEVEGEATPWAMLLEAAPITSPPIRLRRSRPQPTPSSPSCSKSSRTAVETRGDRPSRVRFASPVLHQLRRLEPMRRQIAWAQITK